MRKLEGLQPERVFYYFEELTRIPRCSKKEQEISDYLKKFGEDLGLETIQDEALNVIIKKPASPGYEGHGAIIIQGHMDMVCEKSDTCDINFDTDAIPIEIEGDFVVAPKTTLGADNGIAVALGMALMEAKDLKHPPLELLITSDEESGMSGAEAVDFGMLEGKILLNIDTEEEGTAIAGCAGGERTHLYIDFEPVKAKGDTAITLVVQGLVGGHSGTDINLGRGNANVILGRWMKRLSSVVDFELAKIHGGGLDNAIPRLAKATIVIDKDQRVLVNQVVEAMQQDLEKEHGVADKGINLEIIEELDIPQVLTKERRDAVINAILLIPVGVQAMNQSLPRLVESSNNLGVIRTEGNKIILSCAVRSATPSLKDLTANRIQAVADLIPGAKLIRTGGYPAWTYREDSRIQQALKDSYISLTGEELKVEVIHAGLECGLFAERMPELDMISFGPNIYGAHAPGEKVSISSVKNIWELLVHVLERL